MDENETQEPVHLPRPSYWPITLAFGLLVIAIGIIYSLIISAAGVVVLLVAIIGWTMENREPQLVEKEA